MPFYEYECSHCKFYTELMQKNQRSAAEEVSVVREEHDEEADLRAGLSLEGWRLVRKLTSRATRKAKRNLAGGDEAADGKSADKAPAADAKTAPTPRRVTARPLTASRSRRPLDKESSAKSAATKAAKPAAKARSPIDRQVAGAQAVRRNPSPRPANAVADEPRAVKPSKRPVSLRRLLVARHPGPGCPSSPPSGSSASS